MIIFAILRTQVVRQSALERSRYQEELQRYRMVTLVNNLKDGIIGIDEEGIIRIYNASSLNILDTNDSLNGRFLSDVLMVKDGEGKKIDVFKVLKSKRRYETDELFYHYNDETIRLSITASELQSGRSDDEKLDIDGGFIIILKDITKQKNLDDERDEFISVVSHELRTPLTIAEGTLSNLQIMQKKNAYNETKFKTSLDAAYDQILFLSKMVNDLSTLSRAERGVADTPEDINVKELLTSLYAEYMPQARAAGLSFDLDLHHHLRDIHVSRLYVTELLQNLITNAIKYTKEGGVTLGATQHGRHITFSVKDTGIGIGKSDQKKVYDKFYRSEDYRTRETRGTGLGLYVSTKLARKMDTFIALKSRINHGSEFSFDIETK
jgi:two-component system sensor histidine kinase VicK